MLWLILLIVLSFVLLVLGTFLRNRKHWWPLFMALFDIEEVPDDSAPTEVVAAPASSEDRSWETQWWWRHRRLWTLAWRWGPWIFTGVLVAFYLFRHKI